VLPVSVLTLHFLADENTVTLNETKFSSANSPDESRCLRGRNHCAGFGRFPWSPAVRALSILLVRFQISKLQAKDLEQKTEAILLEGERGSLAASLDYSISKDVGWLADIFGVETSGRPIVRSVVGRLNPERKRPGPVRLYIQPTWTKELTVKIIVNGAFKENLCDLVSLEAALTQEHTVDTSLSQEIDHPMVNKSVTTELQVSTAILNKEPYSHLLPQARLTQYLAAQRARGSLPAPFNESGWHEWLFGIYQDEVTKMLNKTEIFSEHSYKSLLKDIVQNNSYVSLAGGKKLPVSGVDQNLSSSMRVGAASDSRLLAELTNQDNPITIACSPAHSSTLVILKYLQLIKGYNIRIDFQYSHSVEMALHLIHGTFLEPPDLCTLTIATTASVLGNKNCTRHFAPLMLLPSMSHGIIASNTTADFEPSKLVDGRFMFMRDIPSSESFIFDDLTLGFSKKRKKDFTRHMEPSDVAINLKSGDPKLRAIIGFPYYHFNKVFNNCRGIDAAPKAALLKDTVLFGSQKVLRNKLLSVAIDVAIRDAWLVLRESKEWRNQIVHALLQDRDYIEFIKRCVGLHHLPTPNSLVKQASA